MAVDPGSGGFSVAKCRGRRKFCSLLARPALPWLPRIFGLLSGGPFFLIFFFMEDTYILYLPALCPVGVDVWVVEVNVVVFGCWA